MAGEYHGLFSEFRSDWEWSAETFAHKLPTSFGDGSPNHVITNTFGGVAGAESETYFPLCTRVHASLCTGDTDTIIAVIEISLARREYLLSGIGERARCGGHPKLRIKITWRALT